MDLVKVVGAIVDAEVTSNNVTEPSSRETALSQWQGEWSAGAYVEDDLVIVTSTANGASVATHGIYIKVAAGAGTVDPTSAGQTSWDFVEYSDAFKAFYAPVQAQSTFATQLDFDLLLGEVVNAIGLINLQGSSLTVIVDDPTDGEVYNQTFSLVDNSAIDGFYAYCFNPIVSVKNYLVKDLPPYANATITIQITSGSDAKVGFIAPGIYYDLGSAEWKARVGIRNYSTKTTDADGNQTLNEGAYASLLKCEVKVEPGEEPSIQNLLADVRAVGSVFAGKDTLNGTIVYGYPSDWKMEYTDPAWSTLLISVEGLS